MIPPINEPLAIVGISCRFPQAQSIGEFWNILKNKKSTIAEISKERWDASKFFDLDPNAERKTYQKQASLLSNIHDFDPLFFSISPAEATEMSPSQKLMLELAWEAIESSSIAFNKIKGENVSVYVGSIWSDFEHYRKVKNARATLHSAVGMSANVIPNRVSFTFGFTGPSMVVDTGCSSSLVALHLACQSIYNGEAKLAIVGGINHIMDPDKYIELTKFGGLSKKGMCSTFDENADGFVRGEGGGALLLKRLSEAERDGDKIYALIRGTAVNNNGFNDTLPATSKEGQFSLLETAYRNAGIEPHEVHYVEAHGTGTKLGDPNEAGAIGEFFRRGRGVNKLRVGSIKTNIGHTEATAGIAGIIKVVLAMQHQELVPNLNFKNPSASIPFEDLKIEVQHEATPWPRIGNETVKAGVNSFGWGGTNAHAVLEEYKRKSPAQADESTQQVGFTLPISAKSTQAIKDYAKAYADLLKDKNPETVKSIVIAASLVKPEFDHRIIFSHETVDGLIHTLNEFAANGDIEVEPFTQLVNHNKVTFVFPGQGAQWLGMGKELFQKEKVFRDSILECEVAFKNYTDWSLIEQLQATEQQSRLSEINVVQPAICAVQIALAKLWMSWGIKPDAVVGHSMGEVAAAHIAGILTLEDAALVICTRSKLMNKMSGKGGAMAVTELSLADAEKMCSQFEGKVSVAVNNSYKSTVLSGDKECIDTILLNLEQKGIFCRLIKVDVASHSPQMDPIKEDLRKALQDILPQKSTAKFISTVRSKFMEGEEMAADYWVENLRGTVQFAAAIEALLKDQHCIFIEANPHPALVNAVNDCAEFHKQKIIAVASLLREKPEWESMQKNLAELYGKGYLINWSQYYNTTVAPHVELPPYPYQRERYEVEDLSAQLENIKDRESKYMLIGNRISLANTDNLYFWESKVTSSKFPFLKEHQRNDDGIEVPVSFYTELALEAATEVFSERSLLSLSNLNFLKNIFLNDKSSLDVQTKLDLQPNGGALIEIYLRQSSQQIWELAASCSVDLRQETSIQEKIVTNPEDLEPVYTDGPTYYEILRSAGLNYGNQFQMLTGLNKISNSTSTNVLFSISLGAEIRSATEKYKAHPAFMASLLQPIFGQLTKVLEQGHYLDVTFTNVDQFDILHSINYEKELHGLMVFKDLTKVSGNSDMWNFSADFLIADVNGTSVISVKGLHGACIRKVASNKQSTAAALEIAGNFMDLPDEQRTQFLEKMVTTAVSSIIKTSASKIKRTMTFKGMGIDSLMAVQLRNTLEKQLSVKLHVGKFWVHPSIQQYVSYLKEEINNSSQGLTKNPAQAASENKTESWFHIPVSKPHATSRLFCFHDAGGSSSLFNNWENFFDDSDIELVLVEMPGRGSRLEESPLTDVHAVVDNIMPHFSNMDAKPFLFLGHSMGGLIAFEVIREMRKRKWQLPYQLVISSTSGLNAYDKSQVDYRLSNEELVVLYPHLAISDIGSDEVQRMLISILKADLQLLFNYQYKQEPLLDIPILAIHGNEDERVKRHQIERWADETNSSFELISRSGGHRYIQHDGEYVASLIRERVESKSLVIPSNNNSHGRKDR